jgi:NAD(P)H-hydrate epimerase
MWGGCVVDISEKQNMRVLEAALLPGVVILDGILGTGFKLPLHGKLREVMGTLSEIIQNRSQVLVVAVDCPSGVDCDTGKVSDVTLKADHTLTMAAMKVGLLKHPARSFSGEFHFIDIGIDDLSQHVSETLPVMIDREFVTLNLPERPDTGHKGTFGTCLVVAGTPPYTGAAYLAGSAAYRSGCGLVNVATVRDVQQNLSGKFVEAVWTILPDINGFFDPKGATDLEVGLECADSLVVGPGWGLSDENTAFLGKLLSFIPENLPTVFDADGLKLLCRIDQWWKAVPKQTILTPHPGEMSVLTGLNINEIQSDRWRIAQEYAQKWNVMLLLKGAGTVIAPPEGDLMVNPTSDSALATAGSGDVLSGVIGGLLAQGVPAINAASVGAWLHAQAGVAAGKVAGTDISVSAMDILDGVSAAFVKAKEAG